MIVTTPIATGETVQKTTYIIIIKLDVLFSLLFRANILTPDVTDDCEMEKKPAIPDTVEEDRKHLIDANIIRIMKSIKELKVSVLMSHLLFCRHYFVLFNSSTIVWLLRSFIV